MNVRKFHATRQMFYAASSLLLASNVLLGAILYIRTRSLFLEQVSANAYDMAGAEEEYRKILYLIITVCAIAFLIGTVAIGFIAYNLNRKFILLNEKIENLHINKGDMSMISGLRQGDEFEVIADHLNEVIIDNRDIMRREAEALKAAKEEAEKNLAARVMLNTLNADRIPAETKPQPAGTPKTALQTAYDHSDALHYEDAMQFLASEDLIDTTLRTFYEDIDRNAEEIERYLNEEDYENLTIRVHALKSSARLIGARALSEDARIIEVMGNRLRPQED